MVLSLYMTTRNAHASLVLSTEEAAYQAEAAARRAKTNLRDACTFGGDRSMFEDIRTNLVLRLRKIAEELEAKR